MVLALLKAKTVPGTLPFLDEHNSRSRLADAPRIVADLRLAADADNRKTARSLMICATSGGTIVFPAGSPACNFASTSGGKISDTRGLKSVISWMKPLSIRY